MRNEKTHYDGLIDHHRHIKHLYLHIIILNLTFKYLYSYVQWSRLKTPIECLLCCSVNTPFAAGFCSLNQTLSKNHFGCMWLLQQNFVKNFKNFSAFQPQFPHPENVRGKNQFYRPDLGKTTSSLAS